jgi:hypothetical protein
MLAVRCVRHMPCIVVCLLEHLGLREISPWAYSRSHFEVTRILSTAPSDISTAVLCLGTTCSHRLRRIDEDGAYITRQHSGMEVRVHSVGEGVLALLGEGGIVALLCPKSFVNVS